MSKVSVLPELMLGCSFARSVDLLWSINTVSYQFTVSVPITRLFYQELMIILWKLPKKL